MNLLKTLFNKKKTPVESVQKPFIARLPGEENPTGKFNSHSSTWLFLENKLQEDLDILRKKNDIMSNNEIKTAFIRGKIKQIKLILELPDKVDHEES